MLESKFQRKVLLWLKSQKRVFAFKVVAANIIGIPDIIACIDGWFVGIETKQDGKKPTKIQAYMHIRIQKAGGTIIVGSPATFEFLQQRIIKLLRSKHEHAN